MQYTPLWQTITIALISGLIGVIVSSIIYLHRDRKKFKIDTLKRFASNRFEMGSKEFLSALNEIFVVFSKSKKVINCLDEYHKSVISEKNANTLDKLVKLYKAMCDDVNIDYSTLNDSFFLIPFKSNESKKKV